MSSEFQRKYRPKTLDEVVGQPEAVEVLKQAFARKAIPHAILFSGPPGTGKTTTARIVARMVGCRGSDLVEVNAASSRGIDTIREITGRMSQSPFCADSTSRVWILDEAHQLSRRAGGDAQTALLIPLEEPQDHVYFFLCSSEPNDLRPAIRSRCTNIRFKSIPVPDQRKLIHRVVKLEKLRVEESVVNRLIEVASGSGRDVLKLLDQIAGLEGEDARLDFLQKADAQVESIKLCRALSSPYTKWQDVADILKNLDGEPEQVRRQILGYFSYVALAGGKSTARAILILEVFRDNYFDCGKAGLVANCFEVVHAGKKK